MKPPLLLLLALAACHHDAGNDADTDPVDTETPDTEAADTDTTGDSDTDPVVLSIRQLDPGDLVVTELQLDPSSIHDTGYDLEDGHVTWIELAYTGDAAVDLSGLEVQVGDVSADVRSGPTLRPGERLVLTATPDGTPGLPGATDLHTPWLLERSPSWPYAWPVITIAAGHDRVLDTVDVSTFATGGMPGRPTWPGHSLQLVGDEDATANDAPSAWCMADTAYAPAAYGTPGARGTSCVQVPTCGDLAVDLALQAFATPGDGRTCVDALATRVTDAPGVLPGLDADLEVAGWMTVDASTRVAPGRYVDHGVWAFVELGLRLEDEACNDWAYDPVYLWQWSTSSATAELTITSAPPYVPDTGGPDTDGAADFEYRGDLVLRDLVLVDPLGRTCTLPDVTVTHGWFGWVPPT